MTCLYFTTGPLRDAAQTILNAGHPFIVRDHDTHITVERPDHRLSTGEQVIWHALESLDRRGGDSLLHDVVDKLDDAHFDAVVGALHLARGRHLYAVRGVAS